MNTYILFLRGINVGGRNALPMKELVALLGELNCQNIKTYIQSGNVVVQCATNVAPGLGNKISLAVEKRRGFKPHALLLRLEDLERAMAANPFPEAEGEPKLLHLAFLDAAPSNPDLTKLEGLKAESERFRLIDQVFYLHAPQGVGRSKLAANAEKALGVAATDRNWRTACKVLEIAREVAATGAESEPNVADCRACLAGILKRLPEATAVKHGSHLSLEAGRRRFAWYVEDHHGDGRIALHCKTTKDMAQTLRREAKDQFHVPKYTGQRGWVGLWLDLPDVDWSLVEAALQEAYRLTAPKKLVAKLEGQAGS